jgi:adenylosuccinate synthase
MGNTCVVGLQWGDEAKGKIVDYLTDRFDVVVRYSGGQNAGHSVKVGDQLFKLHLLPSGILHPGVMSVIATGVVLDPAKLLEEIDGVVSRGVQVGANLAISDRAHVVFPYHKRIDELSERKLNGGGNGSGGGNGKAGAAIGTTGRGIGPCYADKASRTSAFRVADLYHPARFRDRLAGVVAEKNKIIQAVYGGEPLDAGPIAEQYLAYAERLRPFVADTTHLLDKALRAGKRLLFEGAQGTLLDIDHGTYPFVTSSSASACGVFTGAGVPPGAVKEFLGVAKAYTTRVGGGPMPTELTGDLTDAEKALKAAGKHEELRAALKARGAFGPLIRERGAEFGTTTGRPRRCGWFDAFATGYAARLSGATGIALMKLDVLSGLDEVPICLGYRHRCETLQSFPTDIELLSEAEPMLYRLPGWREDISSCRRFEDLPPAAQRYVLEIEKLMKCPVKIVGVGPERSQTLFRE